MLPQPIFLNKLIRLLSDDSLSLHDITRGVNRIFSKQDFQEIVELNLEIMGIAKLLIKGEERLNILSPVVNVYDKIKFYPVEVSLNEEIDIDLLILNDFKHSILTEIIRKEYKHNIIKELEIKSNDEIIKIICILNEIPRFLKSFYNKCEFRDYGIADGIAFDKIWNHKENNIRYFAILTSYGAKKLKLRLDDTKEKEDEINILEITL